MRLLILDIDGVMIDAERSFMEAVARALADLAPSLPWSETHFRAFKRAGTFNDDFRLTAAALALHEAGQLDALRDSETWSFFHLEPRIAELYEVAREAVRRHYEHTRRQEQALITLPELEATGWALAICTGRPPDELDMAFGVLGFELPFVCDSEPRFRKPRPDGLLHLAERFGTRQILFVGDTRDDATALRAARELRPDLEWRFAAIGPDRERIAQPGDLQEESLRKLLPRLS